MVVLYFYDADHQPRWALGAAPQVDPGGEIEVEMRQFSGFCLNCPASEPESTPVGSVRLTLAAPSLDLAAGNLVTIDVNFAGAPGGSWLRADKAIQLLSDPDQ